MNEEHIPFFLSIRRSRRILLLSFMLLFCFVFNSTKALADSQQNPVQNQRKISIEVRNEKLSDVLKKVEAESGYKINFNYEDINPYKVSVRVNNITISDALNAIIRSIPQLPFAFTIDESSKIITFRKSPKKQSNASSLLGKITDEKGEPLIGASIRIKGGVTGTITDIDGNFDMPIPSGSQNITFLVSYVGMTPKEIKYEGQNYLEIELADATSLSEVVVTGIFNKAKESYTGAATSISAEDIKMAGQRSVLTSIRNLDPSFNIADNVLMGSDPNGIPSITVRGSSSLNIDVNDLQSSSKTLRDANQPLFIVDGFETTIQKVMDFDENRIESITLLKDASATSLYGTRGANGVVVITTRRPEAGKLQVTYTGSLNIEAPDLSSYSLLNAKEKLQYETAAGLYESKNASEMQKLQNLYNTRKIEAERGVDTYWLKYPVRTGVGSKHSLWLEGGESAVRYSGNLSYNNIEGAMKGSSRNTFNGGMFLSYTVKNLIFQNDLQITSSDAKRSPYGLFSTYANTNSYWKPYDDDGNFIKKLEDKYRYGSEVFKQIANTLRTNTHYNPLWNAYLPSKNEEKYTEIVNNFSVEWHILPKELFFRGRFSITSQSNREDIYKSAEHTDFEKLEGDDYKRRGTYRYATGNVKQYEADITANYSKVFNKVHQVYTGIGLNIAEDKYEKYSILAEGITVLNMDFLGMASQYEKEGRPVGNEGITRRLGSFFSGNYTYDRRYFIDASLKVEGSSQFGKDKRYAPFWSTGIGWNIYNETFLKNHPIVNVARLRFSYGTSGSQDFKPYQALSMYKDNGGKNYQGWYGLSLMALGNADLGWQTTNQFNVGTEAELFDHRFKLNVDVYKKVTNSLLSDVDLPTSSGFSKYKANVGKLENKGIEVTASAYIIRDKSRDLAWMVGASLAHNKNIIKQISNSLEFLNDELLKSDDVNPSLLYKEGESINTIYAVRSKGIDPSNGKEIYIKADGTETYTWDAKDKVACGVAEPTIKGTINSMIRFKGFTYTAYFGYRLGGKVYNQTLVNRVENVNPYNNADKRVLYDRWKNPGDKAFFKSVQDLSNTYATSRMIMKDNAFYCQSMTLRYEVPTKWSKQNLRISYLSLSGTAEEIFHSSTIKRERGLDYPFSRKFTFSLTARF